MSTAPDLIKRLVDRFQQQADRIRSADYNETLIRIDFINPLMKSLGWDIDNSAGYAEQYREVVHEDRIRVAGQTKAPDYSFRIGGTRRFFLEAKKPAVDIQNSWEPAYQIRRYAWSAKLATSVLTDFEEFAIYDTRIQPKQFDKASVGRRDYLTYADYVDRWEFLYGTFSKDAVLRGEFDRYSESKKGRGAAPFDDVFLNEIEEWRKALAISLARRNETLDEAPLNFAVQRIIDRILFLRIAEDRGTETVGQLRSLINGEGVYPRLVTLFNRADERYNSGLFHFAKEKDRDEIPDTLTPTLEVEDKTLKVIINGLYYPQSPYEFTMVSAEILGSVYERFLGKVITLTGGHTARLVEKPEVRKAGGVYYTPDYIVNYIVQNTVGKLLEGKNPKDAAKIKVLDPACGSGSFLIGAYQFLLDWYLKQYVSADPDALAQQKNAPIRPAIVKPAESPLEGPIIPGWGITITERKRILLAHLHGVDLDAQAVEVTKLNLLLKCLEGETSQTLGFAGRLFRERALPDLGKNILCGNSLIGTDIIGTPAWEQMTPEERERVNPFDYERAFPQVFKGKDRGFDAVIGNPPYGAAFTESEKAYLFERYPVLRGQPESYEYFLHRMFEELRSGGFGSFIVPTNFVESERADGLRQQLLEECSIVTIQNFRYAPWRDNASEPLVIVIRNAKPPADWKVAVTHPKTVAEFTTSANAREAIQSEWNSTVGKRFLLRSSLALLRRIEGEHPNLGEDYDVTQGIIVYKTREEGKRNQHIADTPKGDTWVKLLDTHSTVGRYRLEWGRKYLNYGDWLWCPRERRYFDSDKLIFVRLRNKSLARKLLATYDDERFFNRDNFNDIVTKTPRADLKHLLAIFNSAAANYWYKSMFDNVNINPAQVRQIPVPLPDPSRPLTALVDMMLALHKRLSVENLPQRREQIQREIDATDRQIDALVYQLYGLTDDEIAIVAEATR